MKRILLFAAAGLLLSSSSVHNSWAFGVKDVVAMHQDGVADSLVIEKIRHSGKSFSLDAKDMHALREAGVSDDVIVAMLRTEDRNDRDDYYGGYYAHPRVIVGLGYYSRYPFGYRYWPGPYYPRFYPRHGYYGYGHAHLGGSGVRYRRP